MFSCFGSSKADTSLATNRSYEIEKQIKRDQKRSQREIKLLLLG